MGSHALKQIEIRPSMPEDEFGIRSVQVATWKSAYRGMMPDHILDQLTAENPPRRTKNPDPKLVQSRRAFVAVNQSGEIQGFATGGVARNPDWGYESELWAIYVIPSEQGKGIGKKLFKAYCSEIVGNYKTLIIWSLEKNHSSHKFYEQMGGKRLPLTKAFEWDDQPIAKEIAYGWDLISNYGDTELNLQKWD